MSTPAPDAPAFVALEWRGRPLRLEYRWLGDAAATLPPVVFLHEGLGSISMWRDFPERHEVLPMLLAALGIERPWLFGHSDGASIALLHAARFEVAGVVAVAPHIFVEDLSIASIEKARDAYAQTDLRERLARHHADVDSAFRGWNDVWLDPAFRAWNIEADLATIRCPVLAVQGEDDEYGTLEQIRGIARRLPKTRLLVIPECGHSPHRDQPEVLSREAARFIHNPTLA